MRLALATIALVFICSIAHAQIPTPKEHFGFNIGDDYHLATYTQAEAFFKKLATSDRTKLVDIGLTENGRHQWQLIVSSPENIKKLDRYKEISTKMARAEGITEDQAKAMAAEGKAIVWIDGGLHADETVGSHQLIESMYQFVTRTDAETLRILDKVVILFTHANPDGEEIVANWYMREPKPEKRSVEDLPVLYQKYVGHDNNRDFFMLNMKETQNMARQLFIEWIPQIMYNHHQSGPGGSIVAGPPYRDPFNYVFDPMMITGIDAVGASIVNRLNAEKKPGYTRLGGSVFSTWYNGGLRTTTHFHNMIGLLTETVGSPTPGDIPLIPSRLIPNNNTPNPVAPQRWHYRQSIDYSVTMNYAVLDYAARNSDLLLMNIYRMGRNSIERGSGDFWTPYPARIEAINTAFKSKPKKETPRIASEQLGLMGGSSDIPTRFYDSIFRAPSLRDARGYVIPSDQPDFTTAVKFVNALIRTGISVQVAKSDFSVGKKKYPAGSYIVKTNQAFRPHIIDMFEPQDHPNDFLYPGGPPVRPYDAAGWTLAFQMGVKFDRFLDDFTGPFESLKYGELENVKGSVDGTATAGYLLNPKANNSFVAVNDLLNEGVEVYRLPDGLADKNAPAGTYFVPASAKAKSILEKDAADFGLKATGVSKQPSDAMAKVSTTRIALWDEYGGSMSSGWIRWLMEQYHFKADVIFSKAVDAGDLNKKYDLIIFVSGAIPAVGKEPASEWGTPRDPKEEEIPAQYHSMMGKITPEKSIPALKKFLENGGKIVTIGTSTNLAYHLGIPVKSAITEIGPNGVERRLPGDKYYVPGSILRINLDSTQSATWGMSNKADVYFQNSPVFKLGPDAVISGKVKPLAWFTDENPLRSGWAWGATYLKGGVTAFEAPVGKGKLYAFGPEITFRGQAQGTFKLLFNELYFTDEVSRKVKLDGKK